METIAANAVLIMILTGYAIHISLRRHRLVECSIENSNLRSVRHNLFTGFDTHDQLLKTNALYKEIYDIQMADCGDFDKQKGGAA